MGFKLRLENSALEDLERKEKEAAGNGPAAFSAFQESSQEQAVKEGGELGALPSAENASAASESSNDSGSDSSESGGDMDFSMDEPPEEDTTDEDVPEEPAEEEPSDKEEADLKKESFRSLSFLPKEEQNLRMESIFAEGTLGNIVPNAWANLSFVATTLAGIGIRYTPMLLCSMFKVVLFTFAVTFKTLDRLFDEASSRLTRFLQNTERQKVKIGALKTRVEELQTKNVTLDKGTKLNLNIDALCLEGSNDLSGNVQGFTSFLNTKIQHLQKCILSDFRGLRTIAENRYLQKNFDALAFMRVNPSEIGFTTELRDPEAESSLTALYGMGVMIGDVELKAHLPSDGLDTWDLVEKAYKESNLFLTPASLQNKNDTPVMEIDALAEFLNNLELLADASLKHQVFYEEIANSRSGVVNSIKRLFVQLCEEKVKVSFKNSVALPLHLKSSFVTKVYMTGALDLHDHAARVIANGLSYVDSMLKLYRTDAKQ